MERKEREEETEKERHKKTENIEEVGGNKRGNVKKRRIAKEKKN